MARHRNVRSMNYADEYDGYDDVYGHSVEDDYSVSPSDAAYVFDRNTQKAQMSAFLAGDEDIAEEDEDVEEGTQCSKRRDSDTLGLHSRNLNEVDEARLRSCLDEIRNVIGDSLSEACLADIILASGFDVAKSLDAALSNASDNAKKPPTKIKKQETPLTFREPRVRPSIDYNSSTSSSLKEGNNSIHFDEGVNSSKSNSVPVKTAFSVPKLLRPLKGSNIDSFQTAPTTVSGFHEEKENNLGTFNKNLLDKSLQSNVSNSKDIPKLKSLNTSFPSLKMKQNQSLFPLKPLLSGSEDSDEDCSSLTALIAQHASNTSSPELTTLSALANFHLKSNCEGPPTGSTSKFVIPALKAQGTLMPSKQATEKVEIKLQNFSLVSDYENQEEVNSDNSFVIDLLDALNPPDIRKQLERPQVGGNMENFEESFLEDDEGDFKQWFQDGTCTLDARHVLHEKYPLELKTCSSVGRILCRRRSPRNLPYFRPKSPFYSDIVPFAFDTPSPDTLIKLHLRRF